MLLLTPSPSRDARRAELSVDSRSFEERRGSDPYPFPSWAWAACGGDYSHGQGLGQADLNSNRSSTFHSYAASSSAMGGNDTAAVAVELPIQQAVYSDQMMARRWSSPAHVGAYPSQFTQAGSGGVTMAMSEYTAGNSYAHQYYLPAATQPTYPFHYRPLSTDPLWFRNSPQPAAPNVDLQDIDFTKEEADQIILHHETILRQPPPASEVYELEPPSTGLSSSEYFAAYGSATETTFVKTEHDISTGTFELDKAMDQSLQIVHYSEQSTDFTADTSHMMMQESVKEDESISSEPAHIPPFDETLIIAKTKAPFADHIPQGSEQDAEGSEEPEDSAGFEQGMLYQPVNLEGSQQHVLPTTRENKMWEQSPPFGTPHTAARSVRFSLPSALPTGSVSDSSLCSPDSMSDQDDKDDVEEEEAPTIDEDDEEQEGPTIDYMQANRGRSQSSPQTHDNSSPQLESDLLVTTAETLLEKPPASAAEYLTSTMDNLARVLTDMGIDVNVLNANLQSKFAQRPAPHMYECDTDHEEDIKNESYNEHTSDDEDDSSSSHSEYGTGRRLSTRLKQLRKKKKCLAPRGQTRTPKAAARPPPPPRPKKKVKIKRERSMSPIFSSSSEQSDSSSAASGSEEVGDDVDIDGRIPRALRRGKFAWNPSKNSQLLKIELSSSPSPSSTQGGRPRRAQTGRLGGAKRRGRKGTRVR
ncbi:hypothetical protein DFJ77DRAFT_322052 [Powellomyces hirtus]|nr:hypothetical protein DFJ77DRAFT_322052 [Powellomyces hirtus]